MSWIFLGIIGIWFINCWRVALVLKTIENGTYSNKFYDHHTLFNIATYILIFGMIYLFIRFNKEKTELQVAIA